MFILIVSIFISYKKTLILNKYFFCQQPLAFSSYKFQTVQNESCHIGRCMITYMILIQFIGHYGTNICIHFQLVSVQRTRTVKFYLAILNFCHMESSTIPRCKCTLSLLAFILCCTSFVLHPN